VLVKRFPRLSETFVLNEFLELRRLGVPVRLFALEDPQESHVQPDAEAIRGEVVYLRDARWRLREVLRWTLRRPLGVVRAARYVLGRRSRVALRHAGDALVLATHMRRIHAAHLHAHFAHSPTETAYLVHLVTGTPFSFTAHAKDLFTTPAARIVRAGRAADFVSTCTAANGVILGEMVGRDVLVYPHGVDLARFGTLVREPVPGRILSIGRLVPKKGFDVLLAALAILHARGVRFECRIVGSGPERDDLDALALELGVDGLVSFGGARPQDRLLEEYASAEIFALAPVVTANGDRDGLPNVLLEAMAAGVPVVSSFISGIPEVVNDDVSGILVPAGDAAALAGALERLLTDEGERKRFAVAGAEAVAKRGLATAVRPLAERFLAQLAPTPVPDGFRNLENHGDERG
jgi:glycosyltransferase involved in cell wall biosynthesis